MADLSVQYDLVTPWGTISFNDSGIDKFMMYGPDEYYITDIQGLDGAPLRTPQDNRPQTDGGLIHPFLKGARHITVEGALMVRSTRIQNEMRTIRNDMEADLIAALDSIYAADGTLSWTVGLSGGPDARSLTVNQEIPVTFSGIELKTFTFGLVAGNPDW